MAKQTINLGTTPTGVGGDTPRSAFTKVNANFDELYAADGVSYKKSNILGTVSQASGVPTGAIFEIGSTASGEYIKYANGTMICRYTYNAQQWVDLPFLGGFVSGYIPWTFPVAFTARPNVSVTPANDSSLFGLVGTSGTASMENIRIGQNVSAGAATRSANFIAIGRWF